MLTLLLLLPVLGCIILLPITEDSVNNQIKMKNISILILLINFLISIFLWLNFDSSITEYQFVSEFNKVSFCHFNIGVDSISLYFVLLTCFITPLALLSNYNNIIDNIK